MANTENSDSDTLHNRRSEFCYQFATRFFTITDVRKEFNAGGKTKNKSGLESELIGTCGYAAGSTAGEALGTFLPHPLSKVPGKVLAKAGNTLFKKIAIIQITTEQREKHKKIHDVVENEHLNFDKFLTTCIRAGLSIFQENECQFSSVTRKEKDDQRSWKRAMSKLAEEATDRVFRYITELTLEERVKFSESFKDPCKGAIAIHNAVLFGKSKQSKAQMMMFKKGHKLIKYEDRGNGPEKEVETTTADFFDRVDRPQRNSTFLDNESVAPQVQEILDYIIERDERFGDKHMRRIHNDQLRELSISLKSNLSTNEGMHEQISDIYSTVVHGHGTPDIRGPMTYGNPVPIDRFMERPTLIEEAQRARQSGSSVIVFSGQVGTGKTQEAIRYALAERDNSNVNEESILLQIPLISMPQEHRVLVTTQLDNLSNEKYFIIKVTEFGSDLAKEFFRKHLKNFNANDNEINLLIREIGTIPMFVQLTCSFLNDGIKNNKNYSSQDFLSQLHSQVIPEYFEGTVASAHCVIPMGGPKGVWIMILEKIKANKIDGEFALEVLSVISYLRPDHITDEYVQKVLGDQVKSNNFENAVKLLERFHILGRRTQGHDRIININPMVQATIRKLDQFEKNQSSLGKILKKLENDINDRNAYKNIEGLFMPSHFHTVFKHAICDDSSFLKFQGNLLYLWQCPNYRGTYDKLFQLETINSVLEKNLSKSDISDWLKPFNRRDSSPNYGIEDFGIESGINSSSCDDLYDLIYSKLDMKGPEIQPEVIKFVLTRAQNTWRKCERQLAVEMFKDAYVVALEHCKFIDSELLVLQSIFYMASIQGTFHMDFIKILFKGEEGVHFENLFERISTYYKLDYNPSKKQIHISGGALLGAKSHLEKTYQDVSTLEYVALKFKKIIDKKKLKLYYVHYLDSVLNNLSTGRYSKNIDLSNHRIYLKRHRDEFISEKYEKAKCGQSERVNNLFEHLIECIIRGNGDCTHVKYLLYIGNHRKDEAENHNSKAPTIAFDCENPPEEAKPIILEIVRIINCKTPYKLTLNMLAHLDVGIGSFRYRTEQIIRDCDLTKQSSDEMLEQLKEFYFYIPTVFGKYDCPWLHKHTMYRRIEDTRPQFTFLFPPYLTDTAFPLAYSWVMNQIRLECREDKKTVEVLRLVLQGLSNQRETLYPDNKLYCMKLFRNVWTRVIEEGHHSLLIEFSELLSWSMNVCFEVDCSNFFNMEKRKRVTDFCRDTSLSTIRSFGINRRVFVNKKTGKEKLIEFLTKVLKNNSYEEFVNESRLIDLMGNFEAKYTNFGLRKLDANEYEKRHKTPIVSSVDELLYELQNTERKSVQL